MAELTAGIEDYAIKRAAVLWSDLAQITDNSCRLFGLIDKRFGFVNREAVISLLGEETARKAQKQELEGVALSEAIARLKPNSWAEMDALYWLRRGQECAIGRDYFLRIAATSATSIDFFGQLLDDLFGATLANDPRVGTLTKTFYQARTYELLGMCHTKGWLLFPFVHNSSGIREHYHLSHRENIRSHFAPEYRTPEAEQLLGDISFMKVAKTTEAGREHHIRNLILASNFQGIEQATTNLFQACVDLALEADQPMTVQSAGMLRKTYNALLKLHNARCPTAPAQGLLASSREKVSLDDFASYGDLRKRAPHLATWCDWFEQFVKETKDSQGQVRKTCCEEFGAFLQTLPKPPLSPLEITRAHINDYSAGNVACYRGYLSSKFNSADAKNTRLQMLGQFFGFVKERLVANHKGEPRDAPWFAQPVDLKFDRFSGNLKSGTTRKAIAAHVMEEMRLVRRCPGVC